MTTTPCDLRALPSAELLSRVHALLERGRSLEAELLAVLAEIDARRLHLEKACSSLFVFCTQVLRMSEDAAYKRIQAARAARRFPGLLDRVADGRLHLAAVALLAPRLTDENHRELLEAATHLSKRDVEKLLAARFPQPDVPDRIRKRPGTSLHSPPPAPTCPPPTTSPPAPPVPAVTAALFEPGLPPVAAHPGPASPSSPAAPPVPLALAAPVPRPRLEPLSQDRYAVTLTVSRTVHDKLLHAQALLRHRLPGGELEVVLDHALDALLDDLRRRKFGQTAAPRAATRTPEPQSAHIPNQVRREVAERDGEQCSYVDPETGRRCTETGFLELDHIQPVGLGGRGRTAAETRALCHGHNAYMAERAYGPLWMKARLEQRRGGGT